MVKKKAPVRSRRGGKKGSGKKKNISVILLIAFFLLLIIYFVSSKKKDNGQVIPEKEIIENEKEKEKDKDKEETPAEKTNAETPDSLTVSQAITKATQMLGVPENLVKTTTQKETVKIYIALDNNQVDLDYANMIISGHVQMAGGKLIDVTEDKKNKAHNI